MPYAGKTLSLLSLVQGKDVSRVIFEGLLTSDIKGNLGPEGVIDYFNEISTPLPMFATCL